jgi:hypothetical protein
MIFWCCSDRALKVWFPVAPFKNVVRPCEASRASAKMADWLLHSEVDMAQYKTVGELVAALSRLPQDARVVVQGGLGLKDISLFGAGQVQIEFREQIIDSSPSWVVFVKQ